MDDDLAGIPEHYRQSAEEIRGHLVALRGGAPFLSPADALLLLQWLEADVSVASILCALERAAESKRKKRSKRRLNLVAAKRHLGKRAKGAFRKGAPAASVAAPLDGVARQLEQVPTTPALEQLKVALRAVGPGNAEELVRRGLEAARVFYDAAWTELSEAQRQSRRTEAAAGLGDLLDGLDEATAAAVVEEVVRDELRAGLPWLSAGSFWEAVGGE